MDLRRIATTAHGRVFSLACTLVVAASCGGGEGGTTSPGTVARVDVAAPSASLEVGNTLQLIVRYYDASSAQLTGKTVTYSSGNDAIASVSTTGLVTAAAAGSVSITATVDGVNGSLGVTVTQVPVSFIIITPSTPTVRQGETLAMTAQPNSPTGQPLTGRVVTWSSANVARATVTQGGVVSGVSPGTVYIRAESEGRRDSVSLRVRSLVTPSITGTSSAELAPGGSGTLTGVNFGETAGDNEVLVNGVPGTVTAGTTTSVSFTVPAKALLPCTATGPAEVALVANGDTAFTTMALRVATDRSLAVGEYALLTSAADLVCSEFNGGARYLITAFNFAEHAGIRTSFRLTGSGGPTPAAGPTVTTALSPSPGAPAVAAMVMPDDPTTRHLKAHARFMNQERQLARQLGNPKVKERARKAVGRGSAALVAAAVAPPAVGDQLTYRMRRTLSNAVTYDDVQFRVVYSGTKLVILEDGAAPLAGTMDVEYVKLGQEFDQVMYDQLLTFGDPLVVDSALDNNGRMLAIFSPRVNNFEIGGVSNQILGFVTLCDFFPRVEVTLPDNTVVPACPSSNEGEAFYALVPDPAAGWSISLWRRLIRGTLIHEAKHIDSYAWRYFNNASALEDTWLEEATAQQASEIWARNMYARGVKQDIAWADGPLCDYAPVGGGCPDPAEGILHHFGFLYNHYAALETKSILDDPFGNIDPVIYGSSWSFMRYVTDTYGQDEPSFLSSLTQVQNDTGVANVVLRTGKPFSELLGMFSLASTADNYPGTTLADPKLRLASWNSRDLFENMSENLSSGGQPAYPLPWPLRPRPVTFGNFGVAAGTVDLLRGGGWAAWELTGTPTGPQALSIRPVAGGSQPAQVGLAIVRLQ